jgi:hypothetical protein
MTTHPATRSMLAVRADGRARASPSSPPWRSERDPLGPIGVPARARRTFSPWRTTRERTTPHRSRALSFISRGRSEYGPRRGDQHTAFRRALPREASPAKVTEDGQDHDNDDDDPKPGWHVDPSFRLGRAPTLRRADPHSQDAVGCARLSTAPGAGVSDSRPPAAFGVRPRAEPATSSRAGWSCDRYGH